MLGFGPKGFYDDLTSSVRSIVFSGAAVNTVRSYHPSRRSSLRRKTGSRAG
jgi:hypothetical protein